MNITFLIGNGFDIGLGMRSKFKDFFPEYQKQSESKEKRIKMLANSIKGDYDTWADFETALGEYTVNFTPDTKQDFLDQIKDFENEFIKYLKEQESLLSFDNNEMIRETMEKGLLGYCTSANFSLGSVESLKNIYYAHRSEEFVYRFINFNYTSALQNCLNCLPKRISSNGKYSKYQRVDIIGEIVHVHGYNDGYPLIGVNDEGQIKNTELAKDKNFVRRLVKPQMNKFLRQKNDINSEKLIDQSNIICVYGMSFGQTDKKWWDKLVLWLQGNSSRQLVIFEYDEKYSSSTPYDWLDKEDAMLTRLASFCSISTIDIDALRNRIHLAIHKNIFEMNLIKERDALTQLSEEYAAYLNSEEYKEQLEQRAIREEVLKEYKGAI